MNPTRKKSSLLGASCLHALAIIGVGAVATAMPTVAAAQDYTAGAVTGSVTDESGRPVAGASVTIKSLDRGFEQTATTSSNGAFRFAGLPAGDYDLRVNAGGYDAFTATGVRIQSSQTADLTIGLTNTGNEIVVRGTTIAKAFTGTTTGITIDLEELVKTVPLPRNLTAITLLAPGTSQGDSAFGNLASIGGSSVAENAYYINGLNTTNFDNFLGSARVPFEMYKSVEVKSGAYPAEFGRATGGIINAVTKSGSNDFKAAMHLNWSPNFLRSNGRDIEVCEFDDPDETDLNGAKTCSRSTNRKADRATSHSAIVEASGPIIEDRLFVYGLLELREDRSLTHDVVGGTAFERDNSDPFWGVKVDAYPIDNHHLEFTIFDTRNTTTRQDLEFSEVNGEAVTGLAKSVNEFNGGGVNFIGKYTGNLTNWLTVSGAYGRMRDRFDNVGTAGAAGLPRVVNSSGTTINGVPNGGNLSAQTVTSTTLPHKTQREFYRGDVDINFNLLGEHHIRGGFDVEDNTLTEATVRNGGAFLNSNGLISDAAFNAGLGNAGVVFQVRPNGQVELNYFNSGGSFDSTNKAFYIQDEWKPTERLTLNLGLRRDDFKVNRGDGQTLVDLDKNYGLRLGGTYDLWDNESGTVFANYGRYFLPFASNTAFRFTGREFFFRERWNFSGFDGNGIPILTDQVTDLSTFQSPCPFILSPNGSGQNCAVTGDGSVADSSALVASSLKATKQDEFIIGYRHRLDDLWTVGISYTNRKLKRSAEDAAIDAAVLAFCDDQGITGCENTWTGFHQFTVINPGEDITVTLDGLDGQEVTLSADDLGLPKARRTFDAVDVTFERKFDGVWSLQGSYTWSEAKGNSEGFVQSDFGQDDAGITQDFDQPGFLDGATGFLPSHRKHRLKLFGAYALTDWLTVGGNYRLDSPRKLSCLGFHPTDAFARVFGAASRFCGGELSPRGTAQETAWVSNFDLSLRATHTLETGQIITLRADVFNLFNEQSVQDRTETGDLDFEDPNIFFADPNFGQPTVFQTPRSVRLGMDISF